MVMRITLVRTGAAGSAELLADGAGAEARGGDAAVMAEGAGSDCAHPRRARANTSLRIRFVVPTRSVRQLLCTSSPSERQLELDGGAFSHAALDARRAAVGLEHTRHEREAESGASGLGGVERVEGAFGYYLQRNFVLRTSVQGNWREAGRDRNRTYLSGQLVYWF